ncbi:unnamed protein product [Rhodiola kirilowii]
MDYYEILGLKPNATKPQIKEAFKKLAMKFHPDKHSGSSKSVQEIATLKFKQVSEAYQVLTNDLKRADYDSRYGSGRGNRGGFASTSSSYGGSYGYGGSRYGAGNYYAYKERCRPRYTNSGAGGGFGFDAVVRFLTSPVLLISIAFASAMLATTFIFDKGNDRLCHMHDSGGQIECNMGDIRAANEPGRVLSYSNSTRVNIYQTRTRLKT